MATMLVRNTNPRKVQECWIYACAFDADAP
jgi:hypothetical protein